MLHPIGQVPFPEERRRAEIKFLPALSEAEGARAIAEEMKSNFTV
jgi:hypothetical protein